MKIKLMSILLACAMLLPLAVFTSCSEPAPKEGTVTRMTVDINPSVEFMVDDQNKVVSVTALNDDGSILVAGEAFIGKTPEEAVEMEGGRAVGLRGRAGQGAAVPAGRGSPNSPVS